MAMSRIIVAILVINTAVVVASGLLNYKLLNAFSTQLQTAGSAFPNQYKMKAGGEEYVFFPVEKIIVSLQDSGREYYFVIDLVLQAPAKTEVAKLKQIDPMVRNSAVAHLSTLDFATLRAMPITELQSSLEQVLFADFASKSLAIPFAHVLVSKLIVQ
jgi:flagellar FliL protein